jgi:hypothetical protein
MWFNVLQSLRAGESLKRSDLIFHVVLSFFGRNFHFPAPEADKVRKAGVSAYGHARLLCQPHGSFHPHRVAGVKTTGHIGRGDIRHQLLVKAELIVAEALTEVAVEINRLCRFGTPKYL